MAARAERQMKAEAAEAAMHEAMKKMIEAAEYIHELERMVESRFDETPDDLMHQVAIHVLEDEYDNLNESHRSIHSTMKDLTRALEYTHYAYHNFDEI